MIALKRCLAFLVMVCMACLLATAAQAAPGAGWKLYDSNYPANFVMPVNEVQEISTSPGPGTFTLAYQGQETGPISNSAPAGTVQADLQALSTIGAGNVTVASMPPQGYAVTFAGQLGAMDVVELEATGASVSVKKEGAASGTVGIDIFNIGAADTSGPITVTDTLPPGLVAKDAGEMYNPGEPPHAGVRPTLEHELWHCTGNGPGSAPGVDGATVVTCKSDPLLLPSFLGGGGIPNKFLHNAAQPEIGIAMAAAADAPAVVNRTAISGGGALAPASTQDVVTVGPVPTHVGITNWASWMSNEDGTIDTQAGSHPYEMTTAFDLAMGENGEAVDSEIRNLEVQLPPGFIGDTRAVPECTLAEFTIGGNLLGSCPQSSMVGILQPKTFDTGAQSRVFNMVPPPGEAAEFGAIVFGLPVLIGFTVRTGGDYGITAHVDNAPQGELIRSILTLWGTPMDPSHDRWRNGNGCTQAQMETSPGPGYIESYCTRPQFRQIRSLLTAPTACGAPQSLTVRELSGWQDPNLKSERTTTFAGSNEEPLGFTGCEALPFETSLKTSTDTARADMPTGLTVEVNPEVGGLEQLGLLGASDIQNTKVVLPPGMVINPGQAAGLQACGAAEDGLTTAAEREKGEENDGPAKCPGASKVGTVKIESPLIEGAEEKQFEGNVYLLESNPPELKLLVAASADGVNLKLVGVTHLDEQTGQLTATFDGTPQLPFTSFKLSFSGGAQAALDTPAQCGTYATTSDFTSWSSPFISDVSPTSGFSITEGAGGGACASSPLPFAPTLTAGSTTDQAGGFTGFSMLLQRADGQQRIEKLQFKVPSGLAGLISAVPLCGEPQAAAGTCPATSHIGHAVVTSGPGPYPLVVPQPGEPEAGIYLTGPYDGAPFGLSIATPIIAGPFNLGTIVTRAKIEVDPLTAQITITTDPLPQIVKGVPTDLRSVDAVIDREGFMFNPTNCNASAFSGTAWGTPPPGAGGPGATAAISSHFQVGSCRSLEFHPKLSVSTGGHSTKRGGASLRFKLSYPKGAMGKEAWFSQAKFDIPKQLPARQSTISQACDVATFEKDRANCPKHSIIGTAVVHTPVLPVPLEGSVYFVSYAATKFPEAVLALHGDNVNVELHGETFINGKTGQTSATFRSAPDVPFESLEVNLPTGEYSEFGTNLPKGSYDFCGRKLTMPTAFKAQNGLEIHQNTPVAITGCPKAKKVKHKKAAKAKHAKHTAKRN
jgi:hypothetical protein